MYEETIEYVAYLL